jgi:hypothetical protein
MVCFQALRQGLGHILEAVAAGRKNDRCSDRISDYKSLLAAQD